MKAGIRMDEGIPDGENLSSSWLVCILLAGFQVAFTCGTFIFYSCSFFILVPFYNLSVTWGSAVGYIFVIVEIYTTVAIGYYGDRIVSRYGRRKPPVLVGYVIVCIAMLMMSPVSPANAFEGKSGDINNDDGNGYSSRGIHQLLTASTDGNMITLQIWFLLVSVLMGFGVTLFNIPFNSWFFESSRNTQDYSAIQLYCLNFGSAVGYMLGIYALYVYPRTALFVGAISLIGFGLPLLVALLYFVHNRIVRDEGKTPAITSTQSVDTEAVRQSEQPLMLPSIRLLFSENPEFRKLLLNTIILNTGNGLVGEFVSYSAYILFPAIRHYKELLTLATFFFFGAFLISAALTATAKPLWLEYYKIDKLTLYRRLMIGFIIGCSMAFAINIPGLFTESLSESNIGTDDIVQIENDNVRWMVLVYIIIQIALSAMAGLAMYLNMMFTRDVIRWDEFRTGHNRSNMYQSALNIPPKILIGFLISIPQIIFYSSGYKAIDYDYNDDKNSKNVVTDDLIDRKWTWTVASYYEIVFFQCIVSAILAYLAWRIFQKYYLTHEVVERIDIVLADRCIEEDEHLKFISRRATEQSVASLAQSRGVSLDMPLIFGGGVDMDADLPMFSFAKQRRALALFVGMSEDDESQIMLHLTQAEFDLITAGNAWTFTKTTQKASRERTSLRTSENNNESDRLISDNYVSKGGDAGPVVMLGSSVNGSFSSIAAGGAGASASASGAGHGDSAFEAHLIDIHEVPFVAHRNVGLDMVTTCHTVGLYIISPVVLVLLLFANYTQIWKRDNSPYLPLTVNMFCACTVYMFYELLRRPVIIELNRALQNGPMLLRKGVSSGNTKKCLVEVEPDPLSNSVGKEFLQGLFNRAIARAKIRCETLEEMIIRGKELGMPNNGIDIINADYDPRHATKVLINTVPLPEGEGLVVSNSIIGDKFTSTPTILKTQQPSDVKLEPYKGIFGGFGGYTYTFAFLCVLFTSALIMIFVI